VRELERATRMQPENPDTWVQLGEYQLERCDVFAAYRALNNAYTLDPFGPTGVPGGPLDRARAYVEKRATCRR
jgi:predicted TPR repeat methyltransferase